MAYNVLGDPIVGDDKEATLAGLKLTGTSALKLPAGTTAQRPTPEPGMMRLNTETGILESYGNDGWQPVTDELAKTLALLAL